MSNAHGKRRSHVLPFDQAEIVPLRPRIEAAIEALIAALDALDAPSFDIEDDEREAEPDEPSFLAPQDAGIPARNALSSRKALALRCAFDPRLAQRPRRRA